MFETEEDLVALQGRLDDSYERASDHLAGIHTVNVRLTAAEVADRLTGMRVLLVATASSDGRPFIGPVDGFFVRGQWYFSTSPTALRTRHLRRAPRLSAAYVEGEALCVIVHGRAERLDVRDLDADYRQALVDQYGAGWIEGWGDDIAAFRIDPDRMFAADMSRHLAA